jgi:predicted NodU family carbamoyl transferase
MFHTLLEGQAMNRFENKKFENEHVILDEGVFINCVFKNCSLEYSGGDVYVQNCQGDGCQLVWRGAAQRTVILLQGLGLMAVPSGPNPPLAPSRLQ